MFPFAIERSSWLNCLFCRRDIATELLKAERTLCKTASTKDLSANVDMRSNEDDPTDFDSTKQPLEECSQR